MRWIFLLLPLAACSPKPDACQFELISIDEAGDTPITKAEIKAHNERLRAACPNIQYKLKDWKRAPDGTMHPD